MPNQTNGDSNENTGLLSGNQNGDARRHSSFREFLFNKRHTPGMESENRLVRIPANALNVTKVTLYSNYVNILLVFVPLGIVAGACKWDPTTVFILNFFAIVPLAAVLSFATEEISMKLGQTMGGLLNATFGNAVELIVRWTSSPEIISMLTLCRLVSWLLEMEKSELFSPVCWEVFSRISSWFLDAAFWLVAFITLEQAQRKVLNKTSIPPLRLLCLHSWQ